MTTRLEVSADDADDADSAARALVPPVLVIESGRRWAPLDLREKSLYLAARLLGNRVTRLIKNFLAMLRGKNDCGNAHGFTVEVLDRYLGFTIGAKVGKNGFFTNLLEPLH